MSDQVILKSNQFHFFKCKRSSNEFLGSHRDTSGKTSTGTMCYTCFIRDVNAPFGKPNPIAAISATA